MAPEAGGASAYTLADTNLASTNKTQAHRLQLERRNHRLHRIEPQGQTNRAHRPNASRNPTQIHNKQLTNNPAEPN